MFDYSSTLKFRRASSTGEVDSIFKIQDSRCCDSSGQQAASRSGYKRIQDEALIPGLRCEVAGNRFGEYAARKYAARKFSEAPWPSSMLSNFES
jgi:hypothetical protein